VIAGIVIVIPCHNTESKKAWIPYPVRDDREKKEIIVISEIVIVIPCYDTESKNGDGSRIKYGMTERRKKLSSLRELLSSFRATTRNPI